MWCVHKIKRWNLISLRFLNLSLNHTDLYLFPLSIFLFSYKSIGDGSEPPFSSDQKIFRLLKLLFFNLFCLFSFWLEICFFPKIVFLNSAMRWPTLWHLVSLLSVHSKNEVGVTRPIDISSFKCKRFTGPDQANFPFVAFKDMNTLEILKIWIF